MKAEANVSAPGSRLAREIETLDIDTLLGLFQWIENARRVLDGVQVAATNDKAVEKGLRQNEVRWVVDWEDRHSAALFELIETVAQRVAAMTATKEASHA